jgi:coenzyme F420-reducing hydrogenase delta subunit (putative coenzyme F420 hydrogenase processing subunit).
MKVSPIYPEIVIAGCGNPLFADDGFGPAVADELSRFTLPGNVKALDAGLCGPLFVFSLLDPEVTRKLIIADIVDFGAAPGSITLLQPRNFPKGSIGDYHAGGIMASLDRIDPHIDITIIGCQPGSVSFPELSPGLSKEVQDAVPRAVRILLEMIGVRYGSPCRQLQAEEYALAYSRYVTGTA